MSNTWIKQILLFIILVFLQVGIFDKIHLFGYATPLLYIYFIIKLPISLNRNIVVLLSAFMGVLIDLFNYTLGMHMLACVVAGFFRYYLINIFTPRDLYESAVPAFSTFGKSLFMRYAGIMVLLHQVVLFVTESLSLFSPLHLLLRIAASFILTLILVYIFENIKIGASRQ